MHFYYTIVDLDPFCASLLYRNQRQPVLDRQVNQIHRGEIGTAMWPRMGTQQVLYHMVMGVMGLGDWICSFGKSPNRIKSVLANTVC